MPAGRRCHVEIIDTWNMTIQQAEVFTGDFRVALPGQEYLAICLIEMDA